MQRRGLLALLAAGTGTVAGCRDLIRGRESPAGTPDGSPGGSGSPAGAAATPGPPQSCPPYERSDARVVCSSDPPSDALVFEPEPAVASLPRTTVDCRLKNELDGPFETNFYDWQLHRRIDGEWFYLGPYSTPMPLHQLPAGATHVRRIVVDNRDLARVRPPEPGETPTTTPTADGSSVRTAARHGLGPGAYAVAITSDSGGKPTVYSAAFRLRGDPVPLVEPETVTGTEREGSRVTVSVEPLLESESDQHDLAVVRRPSSSRDAHRVVDEQLYNVRFAGLRAAFANLKDGVETVVVEGDDSGFTRNLASGMGPSFIEYDGETFELLLGGPPEGTPTGERDLSGGWPAFAADARNTGHVATAGPTNPTETWRFESPGRIFDAPTVAGDLVLVPSNDGTLYALTASDGERVWRYPVGGQIRTTPAVVDGTAYVAGTDGGLHAVAAGSGERQWRFGADGERIALSHPTVADGTVYVGSDAGTLYAVDAASGAERWRASIDGSINTSPAVDEGGVYVGWRGAVDGPGERPPGGLDAYTTDGTRRWRVQPDDVDGSPTLADGTVYAGTRAGLRAYDAESGTEQWRHGTAVSFGSPAAVDGRVYAGGRNGRVYALDAASGEQRWGFGTDKWANYAPAVGESLVAVASWDDHVYGVDRDGGSERWQVELTTPLSAPALADGTVYVASDTDIVALRDA